MPEAISAGGALHVVVKLTQPLARKGKRDSLVSKE